LSPEKEEKLSKLREEFRTALADDLNVSKALAVLWSVLKSNIPSEDKYDMALTFDEVLGLRLSELQPADTQIPERIAKLIEERENLRKIGEYEKADELRKQIEESGYKIEDSSGGLRIKKLA
jgi:cysteinyl-tRNA synthetase